MSSQQILPLKRLLWRTLKSHRRDIMIIVITSPKQLFTEYWISPDERALLWKLFE